MQIPALIFLAQVDQGWRQESSSTPGGLIGGLVILAIGAFFFKKWAGFCDTAFDGKKKMGTAVFLSPFLALALYVAHSMTKQSRNYIADSEPLTFTVNLLIACLAIATFVAIVSVIAEFFER